MPEKTVQDLKEYMSTATLVLHGDNWERGAARLLQQVFPNYEEFWRVFALPYRKSAESIQIRTDLPRSHEAVCIYNYSVMRTCVRLQSFWREAQRRVETTGDTSSEVFEDFFTRMATGCDQIAQFICCVHCALVKRQKRLDVKVKDWTQKRITEPAYEWLSGLDDGQLLTRFQQCSEEIARYRNHIVHGPKWPGYEDRVPRPENVHELIYWSDWAKSMQDESHWRSITTDRFTVMSENRKAFFGLVNDIWGGVTDYLFSSQGGQELANIHYR
jgi:hypothetical protein